jgi:two-component system response regulator YesN
MLLDIMLPELDGLSVMREAKSAGICPRTVILSGYGTFIHAREAFMLGAADFLQKPCPEFEILSKLEKLISPMEPERGHIPEGAGRPGSVVSEALAFMEAHYPEALTLSQVAKKIGVSPNYLSALFSKTAHVGFTEKLNRLRIERACEYFAAGGVRTYEVAFKVGFKDEKYFSNVFKKIMGVSPSQYRKSL